MNTSRSLIEVVAVLRSIARVHRTSNGERVGFFMSDAVGPLGGLAQASNSLALLLAEGWVDSEPVFIGEDVHTFYRIADRIPTVH